MNRLSNKNALITGGNSGIGYATAAAFVKEGAQVIITGRNSDTVKSSAEDLKVTGIVADQADLDSIKNLASEAAAKFGKLDIIFMNAGIAAFAPFETATEKHFDDIMNINFKGLYFTLQGLLPILNDGGSIIFNTSINANIGMPGSSVYAASKGAVLSLARVLATELAGRQIRVNSISPGPVTTPLYNTLGMSQDDMAAMGAMLSNKILLKRFGHVDEVALAAVFLASADAGFMTGSELIIDGGLSVNSVTN
jgi:NAD(P)-dependent dehydrogenase (short-subunit alcohol dehydrogenase family)